jgi:hypothetical protein
MKPEQSRDDDPLESDQDTSDSIDIEPCPFCGKSISATADLCAHCRNFVIHDDLDGGLWVGWRWVAAVLLLMSIFGLILWRH